MTTKYVEILLNNEEIHEPARTNMLCNNFRFYFSSKYKPISVALYPMVLNYTEFSILKYILHHLHFFLTNLL